MSGYYSDEMKREFMDILTAQNIPLYSQRGVIEDRSWIDPEKHGSLACVPTAGKCLPKLAPKYKVVLSPDVSEKLQRIMVKMANFNYTGEKTEIGFLLVGEEKSDGTIAVDDMKVYDMGYRSVGFNKAQEGTVMQLIDAMKAYGEEHGTKPFLIFGHTHPEQPEFPNYVSNSWSLGDLWANYVERQVIGGRIKHADLVITPSLDTNLLFYEDGSTVGENHKGFYRFAEGVHFTDRRSGRESVNSSYTNVNSPSKRHDPRQCDPDILS